MSNDLFTPFENIRLDPDKIANGVWIEHPDTFDRLRVRRWGCPQHLAAFTAACEDYDRRHGAGMHKERAAQPELEAVAMATGLIVDWSLTQGSDRPYDATQMAAALADPALIDLRDWIIGRSQDRKLFRPTPGGS